MSREMRNEVKSASGGKEEVKVKWVSEREVWVGENSKHFKTGTDTTGTDTSF